MDDAAIERAKAHFGRLLHEQNQRVQGIAAEPASLIRAASMLVSHIGYPEKSRDLDMALDICGQYERTHVITGRFTGVTGTEFTNYVLDWLVNPKLRDVWSHHAA